MTDPGLRRIFVDFNNRVKRADGGEYYRVPLSEVKGLKIGTRVLATDLDQVELEAELATILHSENAALVRINFDDPKR